MLYLLLYMRAVRGRVSASFANLARHLLSFHTPAHSSSPAGGRRGLHPPCGPLAARRIGPERGGAECRDRRRGGVLIGVLLFWNSYGVLHPGWKMGGAGRGMADERRHLPRRDGATGPRPARRRIRIEDLLGHEREVVLLVGAEEYVLRLTRNARLVLNK